MIELKGDIWQLAEPNDIICITTNGFVKRDGGAVMGRGIAQEAKIKFPGIEYRLGSAILNNGDFPALINDNPTIFSFPVKVECLGTGIADRNHYLVSHMRGKFNDDEVIPGWALKAELSLIIQSAAALVSMLFLPPYDGRNVYLPRMGCGAGELSWNEVREAVVPILRDDKFKVCSF
jgi:hypothetical protein